MSYLVLARKYRPQTFEQVIDQAHVTRTLSNAIASGRMAHAVLFSGPRGTGKTTVARILAKAMNCRTGPTPHPCNQCRSCREITGGHAADVYEIDGASNNSVEQVRELRETIKYMPAHSPYKIYIIDEVHMLSTAAFNALLKTLEEPPPHVMFIFATTEPHKIPITIHSRCQRYDFRRIDIDAIIEHMQSICESEAAPVGKDSLTLLANEAGGSMRDALSLLDQIMACTSEQVTYEQVVDLLGIVDSKRLFDITTALLSSDAARILALLDQLYDRGIDMKRLYADLVGHFRNLVLIKMGIDRHHLLDLPAHEIQHSAKLVENVSSAYLHQVFEHFFKHEATVKYASHPKLALEMIFLRLLQVKPALRIDALIDKLDLLRHEMALQPPSESPPAPTGTAAQQAGSASNNPGRQKAVQPAESRAEDRPFSESDHAPALSGTSEAPVEKAWQRVKEAVSTTNPSLSTTLVNSCVKQISESRIEIEVQANDFQLSMIQRDRGMKALERACLDEFGRRLKIRITAVEAPAAQPVKKKEDLDQIKQDALNHPLVAEALDLFKGKLVDVKILKEE